MHSRWHLLWQRNATTFIEEKRKRQRFHNGIYVYLFHIQIDKQNPFERPKTNHTDCKPYDNQTARQMPGKTRFKL